MNERTAKILLIDDDESELVIIRDFLEETNDSVWAFEVDWIGFYDDGLRAIRSGEYEAYLIDYRLGKQNGIDLIREIQAEELDRVMIICTGQGSQDIDMKAAESGASDYLIKGEFDSAILQRSIRSAIEQNHYKKRLRYQTETLKNIHDAVFYIDGEGIVRDWNAGAEKIFGIPAADAIGKPVARICSDSGGRQISSRILPAISKNGVADEAIRFRLLSGKEVVLQTKAIPSNFCDEEGVLLCANDITVQKKLEAEIMKVSENEQRRIGQDIHDDLCSHLSGIGCLTEAMEQQLRENHRKEAEMIAGISEMVAKAGVKARTIAKGLIPSALETQGLIGALRELAERSHELYGIHCIVSISETDVVDRLCKNTCVQLYRIAQEALTNSVRHSDANLIEISLGPKNGRIELSVKDDGKGILQDTASAGMGLLTMRRRAEIIGADFDIHGSLDKGTIMQCSLPYLEDE